jgi:hypothetical protein
MRATRRTFSPYRRPQPLEASWQCSVSGQLLVFNPDPFAAEPDPQPSAQSKPRCPCHFRLMRRATAPWYGFPGSVGKAAFLGSVLLGVWTLWNVLPAFQELRLLMGPG